MKLFEEIPKNLASKKEWKRRGYKVKKKARPAKYFKEWNGMHFISFWLYDFENVECIRGEKARIRRRTFHHSWLEEVQKECS